MFDRCTCSPRSGSLSSYFRTILWSVGASGVPPSRHHALTITQWRMHELWLLDGSLSCLWFGHSNNCFLQHVALTQASISAKSLKNKNHTYLCSLPRKHHNTLSSQASWQSTYFHTRDCDFIFCVCPGTNFLLLECWAHLKYHV